MLRKMCWKNGIVAILSFCFLLNVSGCTTKDLSLSTESIAPQPQPIAFEHDSSPAGYAQYFEKLGDYSFDVGDLESAIAHYNRSILLYPKTDEGEGSRQLVLLKKARCLLGTDSQEEIYGMLDGISMPNEKVKIILLSLVEQFSEALSVLERYYELNLSSEAKTAFISDFERMLDVEVLSPVQKAFLFHQVAMERISEADHLIGEKELFFQWDEFTLREAFPLRYAKFMDKLRFYQKIDGKADEEIDFLKHGQLFVANYPDDIIGYSLLARHDFEIDKDWQGLVSHVEKVLEISPYGTRDLRDMGKALVKQGYIKEAHTMADTILTDSPDHIPFMKIRFDANLQLKKYTEAIEDYTLITAAESSGLKKSLPTEKGIKSVMVAMLQVCNNNYPAAASRLSSSIKYDEDKDLKIFAYGIYEAGFDLKIFKEKIEYPQEVSVSEEDKVFVDELTQLFYTSFQDRDGFCASFSSDVLQDFESLYKLQR